MKAALLALVGLMSFGTPEASLVEPVQRVLMLMRHIKGKLEKDAKKEEELYMNFYCWGKNVVTSKTESNEAAQTRVDSLKAYVADLDSGKIELTSERADLEADIKKVSEAIEVAINKRAEENANFEDAKDEMEKAITALTKAIEVLEEATKKNATESLVSLKSNVHSGSMTAFADQAAEGATLYRATEIADKFLKKGDALFLRRLLTGEVPTVDWKKLNRKATFKMTYEARSTNIQAILKKLLHSFESNLEEATAKEAKQLADFTALKGSLDKEKGASEESYSKMEGEKGAKSAAKAEATEEINALETQISNDKGFIQSTKDAMSQKLTEYKERKAVRAGEIEALAKAISILHSDDARDLFHEIEERHEAQMAAHVWDAKANHVENNDDLMKVHVPSHTGFLQLSQTSTAKAKSVLLAKAMQTIAQAGRAAKDQSLVVFAEKETPKVDSSPVDFGPVLQAINTMIANLEDDEKTELAKKEACEKQRMEDTREAIETSRLMDDLTDTMSRLDSEIQQTEEDIEAVQAKVNASKEDMSEARKIRMEEKAAYLEALADDEEAEELVSQAREVVKKYYDEIAGKSSDFLQRQAPGEAPKPPPRTWEGDYKGLQHEGAGVIMILTLVRKDIQNDIDQAKLDEKKAEDDFIKAEAEHNAELGNLQQRLTQLAGIKGDKESAKVTAKSTRKTKHGLLEATYSDIDAQETECNFLTVNFDLRSKNRYIELDGLQKAKTILSGGRFTAPKDAGREIKPGDAFLQQITHH